MRNKLYDLGNKERHQFTGEFVRTGYKSYDKGYSGFMRCSPTLLLSRVQLNDEVITDHLWMNYGLQFLRLGILKPGDQITFNARVDRYTKGRFPDKIIDYRLSNPSKVKIIQPSHPYQPLPIDDRHALIGYIMEENAVFYIKNDRPYEPFFVNSYRAWLRTHNK